MSLTQWFGLELRRLLRRRATVLMAVLMPVLGVLLFCVIFVPLLEASTGVHSPYAVCVEDGSEPLQWFLRLITNSESIKENARVYPVPDMETGRELLESGQVSVLLHIPAGFCACIEEGRSAVMEIIAYPRHSFEQTYISLTMDGALKIVGQSQNLLLRAQRAALEAGAGRAEAEAFMNESIDRFMEQYMQRRSVLGESGMLSRIIANIPMESYIASLFVFFGAMAMLPSLGLYAADMGGPVLRRGLLSGRAAAIAVLIAAMALISVTFSALALLLGALAPEPRTALWCGFYAILFMALVSGVLIEESLLPGFAVELGRVLPFRPAVSLLRTTLFAFDPAQCLRDMLPLAAASVLFITGGVLLLKKRGGAV